MKKILTKFKGNYITALRFFELPDAFAEPQGHKKALQQINKDLPRIHFAVTSNKASASFQEFKRRWRNASTNDNFSFSQGDMTGGPFPPIYFQLIIMDVLAEGKDKSFNAGFRNPEKANPYMAAISCHQKICFGFINDRDEISGVDLSYNIYNPSQWMMSIMSKATAIPKKRRISVYLHQTPLPTGKKQKFSNYKNLLEDLGSESVQKLMSLLVDPDTGEINTEFTNTLLCYFAQYLMISPEEIIRRYRQRKRASYHEVRQQWEQRLPILQEWLAENGIAHNQQVPIFLPPDEIQIHKWPEQIGSIPDYLETVAFTKANKVSRRLYIIPLRLPYFNHEDLYFPNHWTVLMVYIHNNRINSVCFIDSLGTEGTLQQKEKPIKTLSGIMITIASNIRESDNTFTRPVHQHFFHLDPNPNAANTLWLENAVAGVKKLYFGKHLTIETKLHNSSPPRRYAITGRAPAPHDLRNGNKKDPTAFTFSHNPLLHKQ